MFTLRSIYKSFTVVYLFSIFLFTPANAHAGIWDTIQVPNPDGIGFEEIRQAVDDAVVETLKKTNSPGLTVAVTQNGRLIYNRGFGFSNWDMRQRMRFSDRAPIGSTSKVLTTLAMMHLIEKRPAVAVDSKVYGGTGILRDTAYRNAYRQGIRRHYPIVGLAIGRNNRVTAWFSDGKFTVGNSTDLAAHSGPQNFKLPSGKTMADLLGIAQGGKDNRVYSWYRDGSYHVGTASDLGAFGSGKFKSRRTDLIVGIAADTDNDIFYAYYHDGKVSSGSSKDNLLNRWTKDYVTSGNQKRRYDIVDVARSKNNVTVTWYSDGKVSKGNATNLVVTEQPHDYVRRGVPDSIAQWERAYQAIEIQHLLSHTSGFTRDGQYPQARIKFGLPASETAYRFSNQYVLSTRPLLFKPGTDNNYSNHGLGLTGHLIAELSGMDWYDYLRANILIPARATNIVPVGMFNDPDFDSRSHSVKMDDATGRLNVTVRPVAVNSSSGSAAGNLKASAGDLMTLLVATDRLNNHLDVLSQSTLNTMEQRPFPGVAPDRALGWKIDCVQAGSCTGKRLSHSGKRSDGTSYMAKYHGYTINGLRVEGVNVAVVSNSGDASTAELRKLGDKIAGIVAKISSPESFDLLKPVAL